MLIYNDATGLPFSWRCLQHGLIAEMYPSFCWSGWMRSIAPFLTFVLLMTCRLVSLMGKETDNERWNTDNEDNVMMRKET